MHVPQIKILFEKLGFENSLNIVNKIGVTKLGQLLQKVASEFDPRQLEILFLTYGIQHEKPLTAKEISSLLEIPLSRVERYRKGIIKLLRSPGRIKALQEELHKYGLE